MLINFLELFPRWNIKPKGVVHIGGNVGEEHSVYNELGIRKQLWFEPNPKMFSILKYNIINNPDAKAFPLCLGEENKKVILHESNNAGQSSSVLELGTHKDVHPDVHYIGDIEVEMIRLDEFKDEGLEDYDFLNIDVQGYELNVLKGMGETLHNFKWTYLEVNKAELYIGCPLIEDLDSYLDGYGFKRVETLWAGNTNWGDALWIKKEFLPDGK